ncbi:MAG: DUF1697 domain-containing protein [Stellaceae bacterium]
MTIHIALLRAVNVGGRTIAMAELKAMITALGFTNARTLLQSGNVVFDSAGKTGAALETLLEAETEKRLKLHADYLVRTIEEWRAIVANNPFLREAKNDPSHLLAIPLKSAPKRTDLAALNAAIKGRETVRAKGRELYAVYPDGIGRSKLTIALIEKKLNMRGTGRNWNTMRKLLEMAETTVPT